jgi:hypothetical protein
MPDDDDGDFELQLKPITRNDVLDFLIQAADLSINSSSDRWRAAGDIRSLRSSTGSPGDGLGIVDGSTNAGPHRRGASRGRSRGWGARLRRRSAAIARCCARSAVEAGIELKVRRCRRGRCSPAVTA